jgi:hypothetical protein
MTSAIETSTLFFMATSFGCKIVGGYDRDRLHGLRWFHEQITIKSFIVQYLNLVGWFQTGGLICRRGNLIMKGSID